MNFLTYLKFWQAMLKKERILSSHKHDVFAIDFAALKPDHDLIVFDYDDTLAKFHEPMTAETVAYLKKLQGLGYQIGIVTNSSWGRYALLKSWFDPLDIYISPNRDKPAPQGFYNVMQKYKIPAERTLSVGDRIGTEAYGAKLAGIKTVILVDKIPNSRGWFVLNLMDKLERKLYFANFPEPV